VTEPAAIGELLPGLDTVMAEAVTPETPLRYVLSQPPFSLDRRAQTRLVKAWREAASVGVDAMIEVLQARFWLKTNKKPHKATEGFLRNWVSRAVKSAIKAQAQAIREEHGPEPQPDGYGHIESPPLTPEQKAEAKAELRRLREEAGI
jgi:hypothetical protein